MINTTVFLGHPLISGNYLIDFKLLFIRSELVCNKNESTQKWVYFKRI